MSTQTKNRPPAPSVVALLHLLDSHGGATTASNAEMAKTFNLSHRKSGSVIQRVHAAKASGYVEASYDIGPGANRARRTLTLTPLGRDVIA